MSIPSPITQDTDLLTFNIKTNGSAIADFYRILSIDTQKSLNEISKATIKIIEGDPTGNEFEASDTKDFMPGNDLEILAGYHSKNDCIYKGIITSIQRKIGRQGGCLFIIECRDKAYRLAASRKNRYFADKKDSEALTEILSDYGMTNDIQDTKNRHPELVQYNVSDWDFMLSRSEINGKILINNDNKISIIDPDFLAKPKLSVTYGESILEMELAIDGEGQPTGVESKSWNPKTQKILKNNSLEPKLNRVGNLSFSDLSKNLELDKSTLQSSVDLNSNDLKTWANSSLLKSRMAAIKGYVLFQGNAILKPGDIIEVNGVGSRFEGHNFVTAVEHKISDGEWTTMVKFGLAAKWHTETPHLPTLAASGLIPPVYGLHTGKVLQVDKDPSKEFRILVRIPLLEPEIPSVWARLNQFYAGKESGMFFFPEIDDEVIISFINNDPRFPVILGSLYSSIQNSAEQITVKNSIKSILTKAKLKLSFDDEKKIIALETPSGNTLAINDEEQSISLTDQNSNRLILNSDGITLVSGKDIKLKAKGEIKISSASHFELSAKGNIKTEGTNIDHLAKVGFTAKGSSSAEISASGQTVVKGAMVMIN